MDTIIKTTFVTLLTLSLLPTEAYAQASQYPVDKPGSSVTDPGGTLSCPVPEASAIFFDFDEELDSNLAYFSNDEGDKVYINNCDSRTASKSGSKGYSYAFGSDGSAEILEAIDDAKKQARDKLDDCAHTTDSKCIICEKDVNTPGKCRRKTRRGALDYDVTIDETDNGEESGTVSGTVNVEVTQTCEYRCK